jgi:hypothetical protein
MKPGPEMGRVLAELYEAQLDGRFSDLEGGIAFWSRRAAKRNPVRQSKNRV